MCVAEIRRFSNLKKLKQQPSVREWAYAYPVKFCFDSMIDFGEMAFYRLSKFLNSSCLLYCILTSTNFQVLVGSRVDLSNF